MPAASDDPRIEQKRATFNNLYDFLLSHAPDARGPGKTILDFGVGRAGYCPLYAPDFGRAIGLDLYDMSQHYASIECIVGDGRSIPLGERSVDLIVSHSVLEHVEDLEAAFSEMNRILKVRGYVYLTVSPLYFSHRGSHDRALDDWEHLDPSHPKYMGQHAAGIRGGFAHLNALTVSQMLEHVGRFPWKIVVLQRVANYSKKIPAFLRESDLNRTDLYTREFRLVAQKMWDYVDDDPIFDNSRPQSP